MPSEDITEKPCHLGVGITRLAFSLFSQLQPQSQPPPTSPSEQPKPEPPERTRPEKLSFSAQLCAASRAIETELPPEERLINDPYAAAFAGEEAFAMTRTIRQKVQDDSKSPRIPIRTRYFDDFATAALRHLAGQPAQFVSLAAGLESRAFRLDGLSKDVALFEVDVADVLAWKEKVLATFDPPPVVLAASRTVLVADLSKVGWAQRLKLRGFDNAVPTVWLVEGLLYYLEPERVSQLLAEIAEVSAPGSRMLFSAVTKLRNAGKAGPVNMFISAMPNPDEIVTAAGWRFDFADELGGFHANFERWVKREWPKNKASSTIYVSATKE